MQKKLTFASLPYITLPKQVLSETRTALVLYELIAYRLLALLRGASLFANLQRSLVEVLTAE
jgi:hypothetical protein